jgi:hypothetical protein
MRVPHEIHVSVWGVTSDAKGQPGEGHLFVNREPLCNTQTTKGKKLDQRSLSAVTCGRCIKLGSHVVKERKSADVLVQVWREGKDVVYAGGPVYPHAVKPGTKEYDDLDRYLKRKGL